jgi:hypothetical protein
MTYQVIASLNRPALAILERDDAGVATALLVEGRRVKPPRSDDYREISFAIIPKFRLSRQWKSTWTG